jgi:hypothetical protein
MSKEIQRLRKLTDAMAEAMDTTEEDDNDPIAPFARRLNGIHSVGTGATSGCFSIPINGAGNAAAGDINLQAASCNSNRCPPCFILENGVTTADITQTFLNVGGMWWKSTTFNSDASGTTRAALRELLFINMDQDNKLTIGDGNRNFILAPYQMATAMIYAGTQNFIWPTNYAIAMPTTAGNNVLVCPDACSDANGKKASDGTTALGTFAGR